MLRLQLTLHGKVQGVFFRAHIQQKAQELEIGGWAANNADGTVSVVAEGPQNKLRDLADWCRSGPSRAQVEKVEEVFGQYTGEFSDFSIRY